MAATKLSDKSYRLIRQQLIVFGRELHDFDLCELPSVEAWESFFCHVYGEMPDRQFDPSDEYRPGSQDPRWDTLLHEYQALKTQARLRKALARKGITYLFKLQKLKAA